MNAASSTGNSVEIDDQRRVDRAAHAGDHLGHVGDLVAPDKGGAQIERVRAFLDLLAPHLDAAVPVALLLQLAEVARAVGVAALADRQIGVLLAQRHLAVERGDRRRPDRSAGARRGPPAPISPPRPRRRSIASSAAMCAASVPQQPPIMLTPSSTTKRSSHCASSAGAERVMGMAGDQLGQPGIGLHRDKPRPVLAEPFDVLGHLARAGGAVEPDHRHVERVDDRRRGGDVGADQQGAGGLDRDLDEDRRVPVRGRRAPAWRR